MNVTFPSGRSLCVANHCDPGRRLVITDLTLLGDELRNYPGTLLVHRIGDVVVLDVIQDAVNWATDFLDELGIAH